jgi:starch phosphorylase
VEALAYDIPIPGYNTKNTISLRIWEARVPPRLFDLYAFNDGDYVKAGDLHAKASQVHISICLGGAWDECIQKFLRFLNFRASGGPCL